MLNGMDREIEAAHSRAASLQERARELPAQQEGLLVEALAELSTTLEELRVAEAELRQQNEALLRGYEEVEAERRRYQELFDFTPEAYLVTDLEGTIREVNRAAAQQLEVARPRLVGKPLLLFVAEEERRAFHGALTRLLERAQSGGEARRCEWTVRMQRRGGRT
jgi:PAS domain S-box-containing protein